MEITNWDDIEESKFIDNEGTYTLKIVGFESKETANGNECHVYSCETQDKEKIKVNLYVVDKALWKYKNFVKACGIEPKGDINWDNITKSLVGKKFIGEVKRQPDKPNVVTGEMEKSKYFEVAKFYHV